MSVIVLSNCCNFFNFFSNQFIPTNDGKIVCSFNFAVKSFFILRKNFNEHKNGIFKFKL